MSDEDHKKRPRRRIITARITRRADGSTVYEGHPEAITEAKKELAIAQAREALQRNVWGKIGPEAVTRLCRLFPSLREAAGVDPWDSLELLKWTLAGKSHGEVLAAKFVLSVWNNSTDWEKVARDNGLITAANEHFPRFDVFEAMGSWDREHVEAMLSWLKLPFWP